jgi:hypothetical protein
MFIGVKNYSNASLAEKDLVKKISSKIIETKNTK